MENSNLKIEFGKLRNILNALNVVEQLLDSESKLQIGLSEVFDLKRITDDNNNVQYQIGMHIPAIGIVNNFSISHSDKNISIKCHLKEWEKETDRTIDITKLEDNLSTGTSLAAVMEANKPVGFITFPYSCGFQHIGHAKKIDTADLVQCVDEAKQKII